MNSKFTKNISKFGNKFHLFLGSNRNWAISPIIRQNVKNENFISFVNDFTQASLFEPVLFGS